MKGYSPDKIRNIAMIGHGSSGKTSMTSAFLFNAGVTSRLAKVVKGNTLTDYDPEEIDRQISINSAVCHLDWNNHKINIVDCPGYTNFLWDTRACLRAVDGGVVTVCGASGVEVGTEKVWEMLEEFNLPRIITINKLDRENVDYRRTLDSIQQFFGRQAVSVQLPIGKEKDFSGIVDLVEKKAFTFEKDESGKFKETEVPENLKSEVDKRAEELVEMVAENDEQLMEQYFEKGELSPEELRKGLKKAVFSRQLYPVFVVSALTNVGTQPILDGITNYMPSPLERTEIKSTVNGKEEKIKPTLDGPFSSLVFKTISDPYTGRISLLRIFSGKIGPDSIVSNTNHDTDEKLGGLFFLNGKEQIRAMLVSRTFFHISVHFLDRARTSRNLSISNLLPDIFSNSGIIPFIC